MTMLTLHIQAAVHIERGAITLLAGSVERSSSACQYRQAQLAAPSAAVDFDEEHSREFTCLTAELLAPHTDRFLSLTRAIAE
ncbi:hypothetical protein [Streptomyces sp. NPDC001843]|uniref:hypothetical protein n=1 Tax=Streptomyces sp. NPDC001843 TaxID=3364617 RepID=UPI0036A2642F